MGSLKFFRGPILKFGHGGPQNYLKLEEGSIIRGSPYLHNFGHGVPINLGMRSPNY